MMGSIVARLGAEALERERALALAASSRVAFDALGRALAIALRAHPALRSRLHIFPADFSIDAGAPMRARFMDLGTGLRLDPKQLHVPIEAYDVLRAARAFETGVRSFFQLSPGQLPVFDACCLAPEDVVSPRCVDASHRIATGGYDIPSARCAVALTLGSVSASRRVLSLGPRPNVERPPRLAPAVLARLEPLHWSHDTAAHAAHAKEIAP